ncbi:MAG: glycosyltransferase [Pyrinomonadaceae bacterium]|nr:glycosyltransferase [Pyrinomonadaceae bacterium]
MSSRPKFVVPLLNMMAEGMTVRKPQLVSVIIPCYNQAHFLVEAIESVRRQAYCHVELIVVDDGSSDNTAEVAARYTHVRCIRQENQGLAGARNTGIRGSAGDFLVFLDADDRLLPGALAAGVSGLTARPECAFIYGSYRHITVDGLHLSTERSRCLERDHYLELLRRNFIGMHGAVMYRRAFLEPVNGFDASLGACEDYDLYLRIARRFPITCHGEVVAEYRRHGASMSHNSAVMLKTALTVLRSQRNYVKRSNRLKQALDEGVKVIREFYGEQLVEKVRTRVRARRGWQQTMQDAFVLLRYYPQGLVQNAYRKAFTLFTYCVTLCKKSIEPKSL